MNVRMMCPLARKEGIEFAWLSVAVSYCQNHKRAAWDEASLLAGISGGFLGEVIVFSTFVKPLFNY